MEDILIITDKDGGTAYLTTNSPMSHYGTPVLRIEANDAEGDFGPADIIGEVVGGGGIMTAADVVYGWAIRPERTEAEFKIARSYLSQWPDGPQLPPGPGRPAMPPDDKRKNRRFKASDDEWARIGELATEAGLNISEYIRRQTLGKTM